MENKAVRIVEEYHSKQNYMTIDDVKVMRLKNTFRNESAARKKAEEEKKALQEKAETVKEEARTLALNEAEQILHGFEKDYSRMEEQLNALKEENALLRYENSLLKEGNERRENRKVNGNGTGIGTGKGTGNETKPKSPLLYRGEEKEFYEGETRELLLSVLTDALQNMHENSRRRDLTASVLKANVSSGENEKRRNEVKNILSHFTGMNPKLKNSLQSLGFTVKADAKHLHLSYYGDDRYTAVFSCTPSDVRSGKNNAHTLIRLVY